MWRALGDVEPAGGTKARQNHIEAVRAKAWAFASNGRGHHRERTSTWRHHAERGRSNGGH